ncbi:M15 family metallopeptidase [Oerskovia paurometabola]|uniref:D-alanyl-D-alanine carboxypeptidase family protein n=1 Tax=Oerskovia paurometabola TaxID=162170 RepID=A0ABW1XDF5_9CELL|nr:M15 family metallopeptidase [Oerskovia paurometabola]MBM7496157.1 hypothetical protein [Oerskovia paurometabola]
MSTEQPARAEPEPTLSRRHALQALGLSALLGAAVVGTAPRAAAWDGYQNGRLPASALVGLSIGGTLHADAAAAFERLRPAFEAGTGVPLRATDTYRTYAVQESIFLDRYRPQATGSGTLGDVRIWNGVRYVRIKDAAAAVPGTSNHGWGLAVDFSSGINSSFSSPTYLWMAANAPSYGWSNAVGRLIGEPWHWEFALGDAPEPEQPTLEEETMKIISRIGDEAAYLVSGTSMVQITFEQAQALGKVNVPIYRLNPAEVLAVMTAIHNAAVDEKVTQNAAGV